MCEQDSIANLPDDQVCTPEMDRIFEQNEQNESFNHLMHSDDPEDAIEIYKDWIDNAIRVNNT